MLSQRLTPCLWFDNQAEEAANYYVGIFPNSRITSTTRYPSAGQEIHHQQAGSVMVVVMVSVVVTVLVIVLAGSVTVLMTV